MSKNFSARSPIMLQEKKKTRKVFSKDDRHVLAHLESMQGRITPEMSKSPSKKQVDSPNHQMKSSFDFNGNNLPSPVRDMTTVYMNDYCSGHSETYNNKQM